MDVPTVIVTGLVTLLGSGFGTALVNHFLTEKRAKRDFRLEKLEKLFSSTQEYGALHRAALVRFHTVMQGNLPFQEAEDNYNKVGGERSDWKVRAQIQMLVDFYFSDLRPELNAFMAARGSVFEIFKQAYAAHKDGQPIIGFAGPFWYALEDLNEKENAICDRTSALAKSLLK